MEIKLDSMTFLSLTRVFAEDGPMPAVYVDVEVAAAGFSGRTPRVAIEFGVLEQFIRDLETLSQKTSGTALLHSISPDVLLLTFEYLRIRPSSYATGPILLKVALQRHLFLDNSLLPVTFSTAVCFELPPDALKEVLSDFRALLHD